MTQNEQNNYVNTIIDKKVDMPFLAGGYTQQDWDLVSGKLVDREYIDKYLTTQREICGYINWVTKPYWA